jgi:hypothetical protein
VRNEVESAGKDIQRSLEAAAEPKAAASEAAAEAAALPAAEPPVLMEPPEIRETAPPDAGVGGEIKVEMEIADTSSSATPAAEPATPSDTAGRSG